MTEIEAFLTRICQIVAHPDLHRERSARAIELFEIFRKRLYARYGVCPSSRPAFCEKRQVDRTLAELRRFVLDAELVAEANSRQVLTGVRHRIDMTRRALAAHITRESALDTVPFGERPADSGDRELIGSIRKHALRSRRIVLDSLMAIHQSRRLLAKS